MRDELSDYLLRCRARCRDTIGALTADRAAELLPLRWGAMSRAELLLYNLRHVQHHVGQLNLILRQRIDSAPGWVGRAEELPAAHDRAQ
jgi:uncharacterized damage-inducible protein DinB